MNDFADRNRHPQGRKARKATHRPRPSHAASGWGRAGAILTVLLLLASACAQAQFGARAVGSQTTQSLTVTAAVAGTVSQVEVLTLGAANGDFVVGAGSSNCAAKTFSGPGDTCTESVQFTPAAPGLRAGAVVLVGTVSGQPAVLATTYLSGAGTGGLGVLVAGNVAPVAGQQGVYTGFNDGKPATQAELYLPGSAVLDGAGNLYIADTGHNAVRMVCDVTGAATPMVTIAGTTCAGPGIISTIAGNGNVSGVVCGGASDAVGDGCPATQATLHSPGYVALDGAGNLYIADTGNNLIRTINAVTGLIAAVAGNTAGTLCGAKSDAVGDGCPATEATLSQPQGVTLDAGGNLYIADTGNHRIRQVSAATGTIATVAGSGFTNANGTGGYNGDGIAATSAELNFPYAVAFDPSGNMYIPDSANNRIREVQAVGGAITASSQITTFAGTGLTGATACTASPVAAAAAVVWSPMGVAVDAAGNVFIAETQNAAIRKVSGPQSAAPGTISTLVQNDCGSFYFNGLFEIQTLYGPTGLFLDGAGNLYIADTLDMVVRQVQGNFAALDFPTPVFQGQTSTTQAQTVENDGNAPLDLTTITAGANAAVDSGVSNACSNSQALATNADCQVGAVFAPGVPPALIITQNTGESGNILIGEDTQPGLAAVNAPLDIEVFGTARPIDSTTTTVTSSPNPSGFGQSVVFIVTVETGAGTLTGTVSISDTYQGTTSPLVSGLPVNSAGLATFSTTALGVGQHSITATYDNTNDPAHTASTSSPALIQNVVEGTSMALKSSVNPSTVGQSVTFTATVTSSGGGVAITGTVSFNDGATTMATQPLNGSGTAVYTTSALTNGIHQITAVFNAPSGSPLESSSASITQDVEAAATIGVVSSPNPSNYGATVTFTATITSSAPSPATGTVSFLDNGVAIGSGTLAGNPATATFALSTLAVGTHPITVSYAGDAYNMKASSATPFNQVVDPGATVTTLVSAAPNPGIGGTVETIMASVALASGTAPIAGSVTFSSGTTTLGSAQLVSGSATITPSLASGSYQIVATYQPGNGNTSGSASAPLAYTVAQATTHTALTVMPNPGVVFSPITFTATVTGNGAMPTGSVNFLANGSIVGTAPLNGGQATFADSALTAGTYSITAQYLGDTNDAQSTSAAAPEVVGTIPTTTVLSAATGGSPAQAVLVAAVLNQDPGPTPTGTITFYSNGATVLGTATLDASGAASLTPSLTNGVSYSIDAVYSGDINHGASTSQTVPVTGTPPDFSITVTPSSLNLVSSQNATVTVTLTSYTSFSDTIGLGCASLPAAVNCHFAAVNLTLPAGGSVSTQLTIDTNNPLSGGSTAMNLRPGAGRFSLAGLLLPLSLGFGCLFWRLRRRHAGVLTMTLALVLTAAAFAASGCGSFSQVSAAPGNYVIQVTGAGANTGQSGFANVILNISK